MQRFRLLFLGLGLLAGTASAAEQAQLTYRFSAFQGPPLYTAGQKLKTGTSSTLRPLKEPRYRSTKPIYGTASLGTGAETAFTFVLDESQGTGRGYNLLYGDANRNRDLTDDRPARAAYRRGAAAFGPLPLLIEIDGRKRLYHAVVEGRGEGPTREYFLKSLGYYVGQARFGEKRHAVALVDYNANGSYGDPFRSFDPDPSKAGDMVLVDADGNGRFEEQWPIPREMLYCGKCIAVGGRFYELETRPDGSAIRVTPARARLAAIRSDYPRFALVLANDEGMFPVESRNGVAQAPVGEYQVLMWSLEQRAESGKWQVQGGGWRADGGSPRLTVAEGTDASFKLAAPLRAQIGYTRTTPQSFDFQLNFTTAAGDTVGSVAVDGRQPPEPKLRLLDDQGHEVAALKFHYG